MLMKIVLVAIDNPLAAAWERFCADLEFVSVHKGSVFEADCDAVVSPANSFGFMDGGIDMAYTRYFGWGVQQGLQELIRDRHHGELLVGNAEIVPTGHKQIPYLISAPTMRVPMILSNTVNPYLAARAALLLIKHGIFPTGSDAGKPIASRVQTVAFPGLGTGVGRVSPNICAHQMRSAIDEVILGKVPFPMTWMDAQERHQRLCRERVTDIQFED